MQFTNVRIIKKANIYFDGKVTSRTLYTANGEKKTLGIMLPGEYEFDTGVPEIMEVLSGEINVCLPGETVFRTYKEGDTFHLPANITFKLSIKKVSDYCCSYVSTNVEFTGWSMY